MGHVVKLAQPGYDVHTAGDENLIYSSQWPVLKIYKSDKASVDAAQTSTITTHDLGYPPVFWPFSNAAITQWSGGGAIKNDRRAEFFGPFGPGSSIKINNDKLVYVPGGFNTGTLQLFYYIFALDLSVEYIAPITGVGALSEGRSGTRVFKIAKDGKDVSSNDLSDFVVHSRARSPLVHSVNPSKSVVKTFTVNHKLGYNPKFFGYVKGSDGYYTLIPTGTGGSSNFTSNEQTIVFNDTGGKEITIVVLKDPFIVDYSVQVTI